MHPRAPIQTHLIVISGLALIAVAATVQTAAARAQKPALADNCDPDAPGTIVEEIPLINHRAAFPVKAHKNVLVTVELPSQITGITIPRPMVRKFYFQRYGDELSGFEFKPRSARAGSVTSITLNSGRDRVTMRVKVAQNADDVKCLMYRVAPYSLIAYWKQKLRPYIDKLLAEQHRRDVAAFETHRRKEREEVERREQQQAAEAAFEQRASVARFVLHRPQGPHHIEVRHIKAKKSARIRVRFLDPGWHEGEFLIPFELKNPRKVPILLTEILVTDEAGINLDSEMLVIEAARPARKGLIASIPPRGTIRGVLGLPSATKHNLEPLRLAFMVQGARPAIALVPKWYPLDQDSIDRELRAQQVLVTGRLLGGAMWLGDGAGADILEATSLTGFAVRIQKGYRNGVAVEGEIAGARTGTAQFSNLNWQGAQGDITRSATLGRVLGGVAMRFGHDVVLTGRAGIGFHGASIRSEFIADAGGSGAGPGDGFAFDMLLYGGLGVDIRFGKHWSLGVSVDGGQDLDGARFVHGGLQFGYGWNP